MSSESETAYAEPLRPLTPALAAYATELLQAGFRVWRGTGWLSRTYLVAAWCDNLGYVEDREHRGFHYATKHKPSRDNGTGFEFETEVPVPTVDMMRACCLCVRPEWAASRYPNPVHRWTIAQWLKDPLNDGYVELLPEPADAA